jgi:signal peptidase I
MPEQDIVASPPEPMVHARPAASRAGLRNAVSWVRDLTFSVLIAGLLIVFIYQPVKVEGTSMEPNLTDQERIFINKFTYRFRLGEIERGDTVVFWYPLDRTKSYIKRVIGLPGDLVRIEAGRVYLNDTSRCPRTICPPVSMTSFPGRAARCRSTSSCPTASILSWATIARNRATAAPGAMCRVTTSMARRCLSIGRWSEWAGCGS